jgi:hypothetical protein
LYTLRDSSSQNTCFSDFFSKREPIERDSHESKFYYEKMVHMNMETEMFHSLPSASWRLRRASGRVQSKSESLRTKRVDGLNFQGQEKT